MTWDLRSGDAEPLLKELGSWLPKTAESWGWSLAGAENRDICHNDGDFNEGNDQKNHWIQGCPFFFSDVPTFSWFHQPGALFSDELQHRITAEDLQRPKIAAKPQNLDGGLLNTTNPSLGCGDQIDPYPTSHGRLKHRRNNVWHWGGELLPSKSLCNKYSMNMLYLVA